MGSLFNGTTGGGGGQGNNCKSLTTRSGCSLKLDDSAGSVTLHDKGTVNMNFDGAGNACMDAQAKIGLSVGDAKSELTLDKMVTFFYLLILILLLWSEILLSLLIKMVLI